MYPCSCGATILGDSKMTKLQLALDDILLDEALELLDDLEDYVDIVEVGTPFMMQYGMPSVQAIKQKFPEMTVLCDTKIMDAGAYEAEIAFKAGADIITVLGVTDDLTILDCVKVANEYGRQVMIDFICVEDIGQRTQEVADMGVDIVAVHTGVDQQAAGRTPLDDLKEMSQHSGDTLVAVAGGINQDVLTTYLAEHPNIIIIGGGILNAANPVKETEEIVEKMRGRSI